MSFAPLQRLVERWRQEADLLRRRGAEVQGGLLDCAADEVEAALHGHESEALTLSQSADEGGGFFFTATSAICWAKSSRAR